MWGYWIHRKRRRGQEGINTDNKREAERQRDDTQGAHAGEMHTCVQCGTNGTIKEIPLMNKSMKGRSGCHLWAICTVLSSSWHRAHLMELCMMNTWASHDTTTNQTHRESLRDSVHLTLKCQLMLSHACWDNNGNKHFIQPSPRRGSGNMQAIYRLKFASLKAWWRFSETVFGVFPIRN